MCGIGGYINKNENVEHKEEILKKILIGQSDRGTVSCGIAWYNVLENKEYMNTNKQLIEPAKFELSDINIKSKIAIAHNRMPSIGDISLKNTHPFNTCDNKISLVHNGSSISMNSVRYVLKLHGHKISGDTDSEVMVHVFEDIYNNIEDYDEAVKTFKDYLTNDVSSSYTILLMHMNDTIHMLTDNEDAVFGYNDDEIIIGSEYNAIKTVFKNTNYTVIKPTTEAIIKFKHNNTIKWLDGKPEETIHYDWKQPNKARFKEPKIEVLYNFKYPHRDYLLDEFEYIKHAKGKEKDFYE